MQADDLLTRDGKHVERVRIAQVIFDRERESGQILKRSQVVGFYAGGIKRLAKMGDVGVGVVQGLLQTLGLQGG